MIAEKIKALSAARAGVVQLEHLIKMELQLELASLPAKYGFENVNAFVKAVRAAVRRSARRKSTVRATTRKRVIT